MRSLSRWCFHHRWVVLALWIVGVVALAGASSSVGSDYRNNFDLPGTGAQNAQNLLVKDFPAQAGDSAQVVFHAVDGSAVSGAAPAATATLAKIATLPHVKGVLSPFTPPGAAQVSKDGRTAYATVSFDERAATLPASAVDAVIATAEAARTPTLQVELGGAPIQQHQQASSAPSELIGIVAAGVILFLAFGSALAMLMPLMTALLAIAAGVSIVSVLSHVLVVPSFAPILATLIGLGVGVDYALFVVTRHRRNLELGMTPEEAVVGSLDTAGRAVLFAGMTVAIALLGMFALGVSFFHGVAVSATVVVLLTVLGSLTLLPAMLGFLGPLVLGRKPRARYRAGEYVAHDDTSGRWYAWAKQVQRRPLVLGAAAIVVLVVLALPFFSLQLGNQDAGSDAKTTTTRQSYDLLSKGFGAGFNGPFTLAVATPGGARTGDAAELATLGKAVAATPGVVSVGPAIASPSGNAAIISVIPATKPQDTATSTLLHTLREQTVPAAVKGSDVRVDVGGVTASYDDFASVLSTKLPLFIGLVVLLAFVLLAAVFRSLLIPLVASAMNLLAVGAALGVSVAVFQWGWLRELVGVHSTGPITTFVPVMLFAILFGLSMDYEVFLVSRIREEYVRTGDNDTAVRLGQAETGRVISAAAAIMVLVFLSFVIGDNAVIKLFGLSLAVAVFLDALLIRSIIVPAVMHLTGRWNWWLPRGLDKIIPQLNIEGSQEDSAPRRDLESAAV